MKDNRNASNTMEKPTITSTPKNIEEALETPEWKQSVFKEYRSLEDMNTWELRKRKAGDVPAESTTWNFKIKEDQIR